MRELTDEQDIGNLRMHFIKRGEIMVKTKYAVVVQYCDIWGEEHEKEIPCKDKAHMAKLEQQLKMSYKHDPTVSSYVVITVVRKG